MYGSNRPSASTRASAATWRMSSAPGPERWKPAARRWTVRGGPRRSGRVAPPGRPGRWWSPAHRRSPLDRSRRSSSPPACPKNGLIEIKEFTGAADSAVEDLFDRDFYIELVNRAYASEVLVAGVQVAAVVVDELLEQQVDDLPGDEEPGVDEEHTGPVGKRATSAQRVREYLDPAGVDGTAAAREMAELQFASLLDPASRRNAATISAESASSTATEPIETYGSSGASAPRRSTPTRPRRSTGRPYPHRRSPWCVSGARTRHPSAPQS